MATKQFVTRVQHKHDTEANWNKATNFKPLAGEIIIYDADATHSEPRMKIGDGETLVSALPFADKQLSDRMTALEEMGGGTTFTPSVSDDGIISWTNNGGLDNPEPVNIKGESGVYVGGGEMPEGYNVQIDPNGDAPNIDIKSRLSLGIASDELIYIFVDGAPVGTGIPQGQSGDVFGYVDENNNVVLTGNLADGTYSVKYEMDDGSTVDIGDLVLGEVGPSYTNLADPTSADWKEGYRLTNNIDELSAVTGSVVTNYIDVQTGDTVEVTGINFTDSNNRQAYRGNNNAIGSIAKAAAWETSYADRFSDISYDSNSFKFTVTVQVTDMKVRFSGLGTSANVVIKIKRNGSYI